MLVRLQLFEVILWQRSQKRAIVAEDFLHAEGKKKEPSSRSDHSAGLKAPSENST